MTVVVVDTQIHGYLRGHQLLSSSVELPKVDQSVIDRLSDVAGPLRPNETFEPYLSGYPLPSGGGYVLARTWQDPTVTRAGCVRTLSLIIPVSDWASAKSLAPFLDLLDPSSFPEAGETEARRITPSSVVRPIAPVRNFRAGEFLEALFLEESKPVVVFGASTPELIATRLLTAVWADFRREFAFSTFARSPRRIEGRPFDLVFAPRDARSKFADWPGRRIDGAADNTARHRWTSDIVERVFMAPLPRLLSERDVARAGPNDAKTAALLRISLRWDELVGKIDTTPTAALGLLDIADSRGVWNLDTLDALDSAIEIAVRSATARMSPDQAWEFITALVRKMRGHRLQNGRLALLNAAGRLASASPQGAVTFLSQPISEKISSDLVPVIADGMAHAPVDAISRAMMSATSDVVGRMLTASDGLAQLVVEEPPLRDRVRAALPDLDPLLLVEVRSRLLPLLVEDRHLSLAAPFIETIDLDELMKEVRHLDAANGLAAPGLVDPIIARARALNGIPSLRELLLELPQRDGRERLLFATVTPSPADVFWLLGDNRIPGSLVQNWLVSVLRMATPSEIAAILSDGSLRGGVLSALPADAVDVRRRLLSEAALPLEVHLVLVLDLLPLVDPLEARDLAGDALSRCLRTHFGHDETQAVVQLLGGIGEGLDGGWAAHHGLERAVPATVASRNLKAFNMAPPAARGRIMAAVDDVARALEGRYGIDIDGAAINAAAELLTDANHFAWPAALAASGRILPLLMRSKRDPVSPLVAAAFPAVYREFGRAHDVPDILKFIPFVDWDRCKSARYELVAAFLASPKWAPGDLALTSCRCGDIGKIFRRVAESHGGSAYLNRVLGELEQLPAKCRNDVEKAISDIRLDWPTRYDWRD